MKKERNTMKNIQKMFFRTQLILIVTLALFLGGVGTLIDIHRETVKRDQNLQNVAQTIAHSPILTDEDAEGDEVSVMRYLDSLMDTLDDIDVISVVGADRKRLYHSNHELIGTYYDGRLPSFEKGDYYTTDETGPSGTQRRAYASVYDTSGNYIGFVMAIMLRGNIYNEIYQTVFIYALITLAAIAAELLVSTKLLGGIKKSLLGYEPDVFSAMYKMRDNILESLDEGIVALDKNGKIQFINKAASEMLDKENGGVYSAIVGQDNGALAETLADGEKKFNISVGTPNILLDSIPIKEDDEVTGAVGILHDRAEYTSLMEDLAGTRYLVDSMRANNHDFTNKLHVILGLIQMEMYDEATEYIQNITLVERESISRIMNAVTDPAIAALLIGKTARASELNVKFVLRQSCSYSPTDMALPSEMLVTIIGNLIENALEAMNEKDGYDASKELLFGIYSRKGGVLITVDDTGGGISEENIKKIFENGYSTKGEGRGTGLYQVKAMVDALGGKISVESQPGVGTSFSVSFTKKENE